MKVEPHNRLSCPVLSCIGASYPSWWPCDPSAPRSSGCRWSPSSWTRSPCWPVYPRCSPWCNLPYFGEQNVLPYKNAEKCSGRCDEATDPARRRRVVGSMVGEEWAVEKEGEQKERSSGGTKKKRKGEGEDRKKNKKKSVTCTRAPSRPLM